MSLLKLPNSSYIQVYEKLIKTDMLSVFLMDGWKFWLLISLIAKW